MAGADENSLKTLVDRYLKLLFGFCLSCGAFSREQAFQNTILSFADALRGYSKTVDDPEFLDALFRRAIAECRQSDPAGTRGLEAFGRLPALQPPSLIMVREALMRLSQDDRELLLLRDQCHLPFERIGIILGADTREVRSVCMEARERLRAKVKEMIEGPEASNGV